MIIIFSSLKVHNKADAYYWLCVVSIVFAASLKTRIDLLITIHIALR